MNFKQMVFTTTVILVAIVVLFFSFRTRVFYGNSVSFSTRAGEKITIEGVENVTVFAMSSSYFRIYSDDVRLLAVPDADDNFSVASNSFPAKNWVVKEGLGVDTILTSDRFIVVNQGRSPDYIFGVVFVVFIFCFIIIFLGYTFLK